MTSENPPNQLNSIQFHEGPHFNLPFIDYLAAEGIGKSTLWAFGEAATPLHFKAQPPKAATPDMQLGTVAHAAVLTPEAFLDSFHLRPEQYTHTPEPTKKNPKPEAVMKPWHGGSAVCQNWLACHADRPVMTREDLERVAAIKKTLTTSPKLEEFRGALAHGQTEVSWFKRDDETGLMLKARTDLIATDTGGTTFIWDLKKFQSGQATPKLFGEEIQRRGYALQARSYLEITGATRFVFVVFDSEPPYDAAQIELTDAELQKGFTDWRRLLRAYAECVKNNEWAGYPPGIQKSEPPKWMEK